MKAPYENSSPGGGLEHPLKFDRRLLEVMVNAMTQAIWLEDLERRFLLVNRAMVQFRGLTPEAMAGKTMEELSAVFPVEERLVYQTMENQVRGTGMEVVENEVSVTRWDGKETRHRVTLLPLWAGPRDDSGYLAGMMGIAEDITEKMEIDEQLRQAMKMETVGQTTGGLAHDFNNLLTVILGNLEILQRQNGVYPSSETILQQAINATERGAALTRRLLAFARKTPPNPMALDLNRAVEGMRALLRISLGETFTVHYDFDGTLKPAYVDPAQLENALLNLALNARDAMAQGGDLHIGTHPAAVGPEEAATHQVAEGEYVALTVRDQGKGMDAEVLGRVFDPFFTTKTAGQGSGLGMSMVHGFIKQSHGVIRIDSQPGKGTEVSLILPVAEGEAIPY